MQFDAVQRCGYRLLFVEMLARMNLLNILRQIEDHSTTLYVLRLVLQVSKRDVNVRYV